MKLKDDVKEIQEETRNIRQEVNKRSLAWELISDYKKQASILMALLGLSIIANIIMVLAFK